MEEKRSKNVVIIALCLTLIFMGVGFAALSSTLTVNGTANVTGSWDVRITNIEATEGMVGGAALSSTQLATYNTNQADANGVTLTSDAAGSTATFAVNLANAGDYVTYTVTVENAGTFDATLSKVTETFATAGASLTPNSEAEGGDNFAGVAGGSPIHYTITSVPAEGSTLASGASYTFTVKAEYLASWSGAKAPVIDLEDKENSLAALTRTCTIVLDYTQA